MTIVRAFTLFWFSVIAGWVAVGCFMVIHDRSDFASLLWLVTLWLPVAALYSVIIVLGSRRLLARFAPTLLALLGVVVGLLPFVGFWPPYFVTPRFLPLIFGIHLAAVAVSASIWLLVVLAATKMGLTRRCS